MNHPRSLPRILLPIVLVAGCGDNDDVDLGPDGSIDPPADAPLPPPPSLALLDYFLAVDVTPDGRTAVFEGFTSSTVTAYLVDTVTGETVEGPVVGNPSRNLATAISG